MQEQHRQQLQALIDEKKYCMKATIVQDHAKEVLLGRDVSLHKHMVKRLPKGEQTALLRRLARDNKVQLEERPENDERALAVVTLAQGRRMAQQ